METNCKLCGEEGARTFVRATGHAQVDLEGTYAFARCDACGVQFLEEDRLDDDPYALEKAHTITHAGERRYVHWDDAIVRALLERDVSGRILDFGSGLGHLLRAARDAGFDAEGLDVSASFAAAARDRSGCPVFVGPLEDAPYEPERFAAINAHFALEYVPNVRDVVRRFASLLVPGGWLRVFGYVTDSVPARLAGARWWNYTPTRRFLFAERTLRFLADDAGLDLVDVVHGGEQRAGHYLQERADEPASPWRDLADLARFHARRVRVAGLGLESGRAFYLRRPA